MSEKEINDEAMRMLADLLNTLMPEGWGFTLLCFETNAPAGIIRYISGARREDMIVAMREMIRKWEDGEDLLNPNMN